jgi:hypothetical protein
MQLIFYRTKNNTLVGDLILANRWQIIGKTLQGFCCVFFMSKFAFENARTGCTSA